MKNNLNLIVASTGITLGVIAVALTLDTLFLSDYSINKPTPTAVEHQTQAEQFAAVLDNSFSGTVAATAMPKSANSNDEVELGSALSFIDSEKTNNHRPTLSLVKNKQWLNVRLDRGAVTLDVLKEGFSIEDTQNHSGSEYFDYAGYLFTQISNNVDDTELSKQLNTLGSQSHSMSNSLKKAFTSHFEGVPTQNMNHLSVRSDILFHLNQLNTNTVHIVDKNKYGGVLQNKSPDNFKAGSTMRQFNATLDTLKNDLEFQQTYPQTYAVILQQAGLLQELVQHLELRWESALDCDQDSMSACFGQSATHMKIEARLELSSVQQNPVLSIVNVNDVLANVAEGSQNTLIADIPTNADVAYP